MNTTVNWVFLEFSLWNGAVVQCYSVQWSTLLNSDTLTPTHTEDPAGLGLSSDSTNILTNSSSLPHTSSISWLNLLHLVFSLIAVHTTEILVELGKCHELYFFWVCLRQMITFDKKCFLSLKTLVKNSWLNSLSFYTKNRHKNGSTLQTYFFSSWRSKQYLELDSVLLKISVDIDKYGK